MSETRPNYYIFDPGNEGGETIPLGSLIDSDNLIDRQAIEARAEELIANRQACEVLPFETEGRDNARTAMMEALTASGHLSTVEMTGALEQINSQVLARLINGYNDNLPPHEKRRRFVEICEELVVQGIMQKVVEGILPPDTEVLTISDYADFVGNTLVGYRANNKKGMVRSHGLRFNRDGTVTRVIEQVSRSSGTHHTTDRLFGDAGIMRRYDESSDICNLNKQAVYSRSVVTGGVVDIQRRLDQYAGEGVLYGDMESDNAHHPLYEELRSESARREQEVEFFIDRLSDFDEKLKGLLGQGRITRGEYESQFNEELRAILRAICILEPSYTRGTFGDDAVEFYEQASKAYLAGDYQMFERMMYKASMVEQTVTFCGGSISSEKAQELGIEIDDLRSLVGEGKKNWKWKKGVCRTENCATRPGQTLVGPCSVCKSCQHWYDLKRDPEKLYAGMKRLEKVTSSRVKIKKAKQKNLLNMLSKEPSGSLAGRV